jgi:hypothetical protein
MSICFRSVALAVLLIAIPTGPAKAQPLAGPEAPPAIDGGFRLLYELKFTEARRLFTEWNSNHPDDPLGEVSVAASFLFEEFYRQGVLTSEFFLNDKRLLGGIAGKPDAERGSGFREANQRARDLARRRIKANRRDVDALFALTIATCMQADFESILEKRQLESLRLIKEADSYAHQLLEQRPDAADAWLALGAANYIIWCLPVHMRFLLWFGGIHGDRKLGMEQLRKAADNGHYLRPFAKIFLAMAAMRENQEELARAQLSDLVSEFPANQLFAAELSRLDHKPAITSQQP